MTHLQRFEAALRSAEPGRAMRSLVTELAAEGQGKDEIYAACERVALRLREAGREADEELVLDVMDALEGWCHPDARLLPDR
jgi:hypothetical protein